MSQWIEGVSHDTLKSSPMSFLGRIGQIPLLIRRTVICLQLCGFRCIVCIKSFFFCFSDASKHNFVQNFSQTIIYLI